MYTSIALLALSGFLAAEPVQNDRAWQTSYSEANQQGRNEGKPLAIFFGSGKSGPGNLIRKGKLNKSLQKILADKYVCVYVNTRTKTGKQLAKKFHVTKGVVISDREGKLIALRHEGKIAPRDLKRYLKRFADPDLVVRTTKNTTDQKPRPRPVAPARPMMMMGGGGC
jgi:thioredoxin-related protein